jgi:hypothetical protein
MYNIINYLFQFLHNKMFTFFTKSKQSTNTVGFEDIKYAIDNPKKHILINTLPNSEQDILIRTSVAPDTEEDIINTQLNDYSTPDIPIIIYGKNANDPTVESKYKQLCKLGFKDVYMYPGGLFEWLLLQDIYGPEEFPTKNNTLIKQMPDILRYKPPRVLHPR